MIKLIPADKGKSDFLEFLVECLLVEDLSLSGCIVGLEGIRMVERPCVLEPIGCWGVGFSGVSNF
jgi:hypothetical protein